MPLALDVARVLLLVAVTASTAPAPDVCIAGDGRAGCGGPGAAGGHQGPATDHLLLQRRGARLQRLQADSTDIGGSGVGDGARRPSAAEGLLQQVRSAAQQAARGERGFTEGIAQMRTILEDSIVAEMKASKAEDQDEVDRHVGYVTECDEGLASRAVNVTQAQQHAAAAAAQEATCGESEAQALTARDTNCQAARDFLATQLQHPECTVGDGISAEALLAHIKCVEDWVEVLPEAYENHGACQNATEAHEGKVHECATRRQAALVASCDAQSLEKSSCEEYTDCRTRELSRHTLVVQRVQAVEQGRRVEVVAVARVRCYLAVLGTNTSQADDQALAACEGANDTGLAQELAISYADPPAASECRREPVSGDCMTVPLDVAPAIGPKVLLEGPDVLADRMYITLLASLLNSRVLLCWGNNGDPTCWCKVGTVAGDTIELPKPRVELGFVFAKYFNMEGYAPNRAVCFHNWEAAVHGLVVDGAGDLLVGPKVQIDSRQAHAGGLTRVDDDRVVGCYVAFVCHNGPCVEDGGQKYDIECKVLETDDGLAFNAGPAVRLVEGMNNYNVHPLPRLVSENLVLVCYDQDPHSHRGPGACQTLRVDGNQLHALGSPVVATQSLLSGEVVALKKQRAMLEGGNGVAKFAQVSIADDGTVVPGPTLDHQTAVEKSMMAKIWDDRVVYCSPVRDRPTLECSIVGENGGTLAISPSTSVTTAGELDAWQPTDMTEVSPGKAVICFRPRRPAAPEVSCYVVTAPTRSLR